MSCRQPNCPDPAVQAAMTGMNMHYYNIRPPHSTPETEQARRVLLWLESSLPGEITHSPEYQRARFTTGPASQGRATLYGMPIGGLKMPVSGPGDDAQGHNRLRAIVTQVLCPKIEQGVLEMGWCRDFQQRLRGGFPDLYWIVERSIAQGERAEAKNQPDQE